jgi:hypothetical protein
MDFWSRILGSGAAMAVAYISLGIAGLRHTPTQASSSHQDRPQFESYSVSPQFEGRAHSAVLGTPLDRKYRTAIKNGLANGVNFAGHYVIVIWGCGTGCKGFVVVDAKTGVVYDPAFDEVDYHYPESAESDAGWHRYPDLLNYRKESALLIVEGCLRGKQCGRTYFVMGKGLEQLAYDPDLLSDGKIAPY